MTTHEVTHRQQFEDDGVVCVRGVFDAEQIAVIRQIVENMLTDPGPHGQTASRPGEPEFFEDFCNWQRYPELLDVVAAAGLPALCGELMGSPEVRLYHDHVLVKQPGAQQPTPWHQDQPFYNGEGRQNISAWIPVDPVSRETTLEFVAGSHDDTWYLPTTFLDQQAKWFPDSSLAPVPPIDEDRERFPVRGWAMEPGDVVLFHMLTLHAAAGNSRTIPRRALSLRFLGADATHAPRRWTTSPPFPGLEGELPAGAPMDHPLFPLLWTAGH
ncbi:MAG: phytanoyl-CoA dioxygenase family protein [Actinobacteria bacterium]|nr:phytanoyl-CoA dioxygenase family protein [Actinomycetota bacterium]